MEKPNQEGPLNPTQFVATGAVCLREDCQIPKAQRENLIFWGEPGDLPGLRCPHCERSYPDVDTYFVRFYPLLSPLMGFLMAILALFGVWFLPWPFQLKVAMAILSALSLFNSISRLWKRFQRQRVHQHLAMLGRPQGPNPKETRATLVALIKATPKLKRQNTLRKKLLAFLASQQEWCTTKSRSLRHDLMLCKNQLPQRVAEERRTLKPTDKEAVWLDARLKTLLTLQPGCDKLWQASENVLQLPASVIGLLEDLKLASPEESEELLQELEEGLQGATSDLKNLNEIKEI